MTPFQEKLQYWAAMNPQKACIIEAETGYTLSYAHYLSAVYAMRKFLGEHPRCIALALPGGIVSAVVWLSALTGGHTLVPLPPDVADDEKLHTTRKYRPDVLIVEQEADVTGFDSPGATIITRQFGETLIAQALSENSEDSAEVQLESREGCVCLHTSGSTGEPKGVILQAHQIAWTAEYVCESHRLSSSDRGLTVLPFFHVNAPVVSLCASLIAGSTIVIASHFSRSHFWSWVEDYQITWASIVPTILTILLDTEKPAFLPGNLRFVRTASAPLPASRLQAFEAKFAIPVIETYGLSEAASQVVANPVPPGIHKAGSVGLPVGVGMRICHPKDGNGEQPWIDVEQRTIGEICFRGPSVIHAYEGNAGTSSFQDGWFRTGDLGYQDDDGYLFITGRLREVINRGGENVAPREVEEVLLTHPIVKEAVVVGRPDSIYGEVVVAYVVLRESSTYSSVHIQQQLHQYAAQRLSSHKVPVDFMLVDDLPRTSAGKVARQVLRKQEMQRA